MADLLPIHTIALFPKIQADTAVAAYLLKMYGESLYPGIGEAKFVFMSAPPADGLEAEKQGTLYVDLGGRYDHHRANMEGGKRADCVATLIARDLGMEAHPAFKKILAWAKRDDLEGKGTISADPLDRAFGLSGLIMSLNRYYTGRPEQVLKVVIPMLRAHVKQEYERYVELPAEWTSLQVEGKAQLFSVSQGSAALKGVVVESDNVSLPGFLKATQGFDLIVIRRSTGHTNILTNQLRSVDLRPFVRAVRVAEGQKRNVVVESSDVPGRVDLVPEWFYDDAANTVQNGGAHPEGTAPTALSAEELLALVFKHIPEGQIGSLKRQKAQGK